MNGLYFEYQHLPEHLQAVSKPCHDLAEAMVAMGAADEFKHVDAPDGDADETELTEEEFDARMAAGEPVLVMGMGTLRERFEDYYSLQITQPGTVAISAGRWGGERVSSAAVDRDAQLFSAA